MKLRRGGLFELIDHTRPASGRVPFDEPDSVSTDAVQIHDLGAIGRPRKIQEILYRAGDLRFAAAAARNK